MRVKIKDICKIISGGDRPSIVCDIQTDECNIPVYGNALDKEGLYGFTNYSVVNEEAVTITARGSNCGVSFLRETPFVPIVRLLTLIPNKEKILPKYLYYIIKNQNFKSTGSGQPQITIPQVSEFEIDIVEDINRQKNVSAILYTIDKKIKLNNRINSELENMAKTIYDYWFLQFEFPNDEGKPYKSSGGKMVWNEKLKKEIPEDWENGKLNYFIEKVKNGDWGKEEKEGNYTLEVHCIRGADIPTICNYEELKAPKRYILQKNENKILEAGDIVIEISGGSPTQSTGRICYINSNVLKRFKTQIITSNFCKCISLKNKENMYWFYSFWKKLYDSGVFFTYEGKTTGIKNLLFDSFCENYKIIIPNEKVLKKYHKKIKPLFDKIQKNSLENQELTSLRDYLLPLLMNGQVGFKD